MSEMHRYDAINLLVLKTWAIGVVNINILVLQKQNSSWSVNIEHRFVAASRMCKDWVQWSSTDVIRQATDLLRKTTSTRITCLARQAWSRINININAWLLLLHLQATPFMTRKTMYWWTKSSGRFYFYNLECEWLDMNTRSFKFNA